MLDRPCGADQPQWSTPAHHSSIGSEAATGWDKAPKHDLALKIDKEGGYIGGLPSVSVNRASSRKIMCNTLWPKMRLCDFGAPTN